MIKILVVDDEAGICDSIKQIFIYIGFSVSTATTAKKALSIFEKENPKIVFLDIIMPDIDGLELLKQFKEKDPKSIVIMVTASQDEDVKQKALALGANEFIHKPFSRNYLRDVVVHRIKDLISQSGEMQKAKILVVDDEEDIRETMQHVLSRRYECDVDLARDGEDALTKFKQTAYDLVLLDVKMPGLSGLDVMVEMKKINAQSKIIIISAWKSAEVVNKAVEQGAVDYLSKPISLTAFTEKIQLVLMSIGKLIMKK